MSRSEGKSGVLDWVELMAQRARQRRWATLVVVNLRIMIGFAFIPAGLKKVLGQPFTDPQNVGAFHEFLHAFLATGPFYQFVRVVQLTAAVLLMTQRFATLGASIMLPVVAAITVLCWSTAGIPTIITVTLMLLGIIGLLLWDVAKWRAVFGAEGRGVDVQVQAGAQRVDMRLWQRCGLGILAFYLLACLIQGEIYRPRGADLDNPAFYLLPAIAAFPLVTWLIDRTRYRRGARQQGPASSTDRAPGS